MSSYSLTLGLFWASGALSAVVAALLGVSAAKADVQVELPSCAAIAASAVARQSWADGKSPFGLAYEDWTQEDFAALARRIRQCGEDPAYVEYIAQGHRQSEESAAALNLRRAFEQELKAIPGEDPRTVLGALDTLSSRVQSSSLSRADQVGLQAQIENRRRIEALRKRSQERLEAETAAEPLLEALIAELDSTAATVAERRRLAHLLSANRYRLPELSFPQQNRYHGAIQRRLFQVDRQLALSKCTDINAGMGLTGRMAAYEIVDQLGTSMGDVVCQSAVATGRGEFRSLGPAQNGIYTVRSGDTTLVFRLGRYVRASQAFFPSGSPAQPGEPAFRFEGVRVAGRTQPAPRGFLVNFLAQFAGPWTEFSRDLR